MRYLTYEVYDSVTVTQGLMCLTLVSYDHTVNILQRRYLASGCLYLEKSHDASCSIVYSPTPFLSLALCVCVCVCVYVCICVCTGQHYPLVATNSNCCSWFSSIKLSFLVITQYHVQFKQPAPYTFHFLLSSMHCPCMTFSFSSILFSSSCLVNEVSETGTY